MKNRRACNLLEIFLITYNRSAELEKTLLSFVDSPFKEFKITILDNCSADNTKDVCKKYKKYFSNYRLIRHRLNIGFGANYLRAVELSKSEYTWIICDDDLYDFSSAFELFKVLEEGKHDIISVTGGNYQFSQRGLSTTVQELLENGEMYYTIHSFVPATIFRTSLFDSETLFDAYFLISDIYPQFAIINKSANINSQFYITKNAIVERAPDNATSNLNPFFQFSCWVNNCLKINNKKIRKHVIYEYFNHSFKKFLLKLAYYLIFDKVFSRQNRLSAGKEGVLKKYIIVLNAFQGEQKLVLFFLTPLLFFPGFFLKFCMYLFLLVYYKGNIPDDKKFNSKIDQRK